MKFWTTVVLFYPQRFFDSTNLFLHLTPCGLLHQRYLSPQIVLQKGHLSSQLLLQRPPCALPHLPPASSSDQWRCPWNRQLLPWTHSFQPSPCPSPPPVLCS